MAATRLLFRALMLAVGLICTFPAVTAARVLHTADANILLKMPPLGRLAEQAFAFLNSRQPLLKASFAGADLSWSGQGWVWKSNQPLSGSGPFPLQLTGANGQVLSTTLTGPFTGQEIQLPFQFSPGPPAQPTAPQPSPAARDACSDSPTPDGYSCEQQKAWGKCGADFMAGLCDRTCGRCSGGLSPQAPPSSPASPGVTSPSPPASGSCSDTPTPGYSCSDQKAWGKCGADFMQGFCDRTCGRCTGGPPPQAPPSSPASPGPSPPAAPTSPPASPPGPTPATPSAPVPPSSSSGSPYAQALELSFKFFDAQRSGALPSDFRIPYRGPSHLNDVVPGGFHDAGDHLKLNFPLGVSLSFLAWGVAEFPGAYGGQMSHALDTLRWGSDYIMGCHTSPGVYIGQIGSPGGDHSFWGRPEEQDLGSPRPHYTWDDATPASDLKSSAAAALAATAVVFAGSDAAYASSCLGHARQLFASAAKTEGKYSDSNPSATYVYASSTFLDDLAYAAAWLYRATKEESYLQAAQKYLQRAQYDRNYFVSWDAVFVPTDVLLLGVGAAPSPGVDSQYQVQQFINTWQKGSNGVQFSGKGLAVAPLGGWGNLRYSANAAFMMTLVAKQASDPAARAAALKFASSQVAYFMGSGGSGRSFIVGYGSNPPAQPHHRAASCPNRPAPCGQAQFDASGPNPQVLVGALVGGPPGTNDAYEDTRSNFQTNEVAFDYNAGFTSALAGLIQLGA